jgi:hypothetical protein
MHQHNEGICCVNLCGCRPCFPSAYREKLLRFNKGAQEYFCCQPRMLETTFHSSRNANAPTAFFSNDGPAGEGRDTGYGQGGSAGTHPTGANVGPAHASMMHAN